MKKICLSHDNNALETAAQYLKRKKMIAFPTDTIYGLCTICSEETLQELHRIRKREFSKPFLFVLPESYDEKKLIDHEIDITQQEFIEKNWPGKKTLIFYKKSDLSYPIISTIALRKPRREDNVYFYELLNLINEPMLAPSLNLPREKPLNSFKEAEKKFAQGEITAFFSLGISFGTRRASQIWDMTKKPPLRLR